jgi:uncharacterized protein (TIGR02145 family)
MKKIILLFLLIFAITKINAQNYQISFAGIGASTTVDSVKVENLSQCTDTTLSGSDILHLKGTVGIYELNTAADNTMHIYPNPTTGNCSINFEATAQGKTTIELFDVTGKRILQEQEILSKGNHTYNLSGIRSGVYFIKIASDKFFYTSKIVCSNATIGTTEIKHIETTQGIDNKSTTSKAEKMSSLKNGKSLIEMQYTTGNRLKLTGFSGGIYRTVFMLVPTQDSTVSFNFIACTDADGNNYSVVQIGTQIWMVENLKTTKYRNSEAIPNVTDNTAWGSLTTGAYCNYNNTTNSDTINTFGRLYNWYTVIDSGNIAPLGWHVPSDDEWTTLLTYLGGESVAGGKLKENCSFLWLAPNLGADNSSGFTGLPGGYRLYNYSTFDDIYGYGFFWSTKNFVSHAWYNVISSVNAVVYLGTQAGFKTYGFSVRCLKDN